MGHCVLCKDVLSFVFQTFDFQVLCFVFCVLCCWKNLWPNPVASYICNRICLY